MHRTAINRRFFKEVNWAAAVTAKDDSGNYGSLNPSSKGNNYQPPAEKTRLSPPHNYFTLATNIQNQLENDTPKLYTLIPS